MSEEVQINAKEAGREYGSGTKWQGFVSLFLTPFSGSYIGR
jgi:hypothetical protein